MIEILNSFRQRHPHLVVILEPGSAIAWDIGPLIVTVLDLIEWGGVSIALLDVSATAHMPDVVEMPYRAEVPGAGLVSSKPYAYRLAGPTCLSGDVIGDYAFGQPLTPGDRVTFEDMIHYTMVKIIPFNGVVHLCRELPCVPIPPTFAIFKPSSIQLATIRKRLVFNRRYWHDFKGGKYLRQSARNVQSGLIFFAEAIQHDYRHPCPSDTDPGFRFPVHPADRAPGARGGGLLRDLSL